jgi:dCTP diphosphatase
MDLEKIKSIISQFSQERDWDQFHSIKNLAMALSVESSELLEIFQWVSEVDSNRISENPEMLAKLEDEIADVFIYLLRISMKSGIDMEKVIHTKLKKNAMKYPIHLSKGNSKKYNQF